MVLIVYLVINLAIVVSKHSNVGANCSFSNLLTNAGTIVLYYYNTSSQIKYNNNSVCNNK